jgi:predicted ATPase
MIRRLELKNFKRFRSEVFTFRPEGLTIIAGGNNSGKSSILHALTLWEYCRREIERKHGPVALESGGQGREYVTTFKNFTPLTIPDFRHLWTNLTATMGGNPTPITLKVAWPDDAENGAERAIEFTLDLRRQLRIAVAASNVPPGGIIPHFAYLPPFAGIQVKELKLSVQDRERLVGQGLPGAVLRNHLCDLATQSRAAYDALRDPRGRISSTARSTFIRSDAWRQLLAVLNEEFRCILYPAESRPRPDGRIFLKSNLAKGAFIKGTFKRFPRYEPRDLIVEGSGFLQWLSVFALAADREVNVLLLDEADVHLHPTLQAQLLFRLNREAVDKRKQILFVTHSTEVLRIADYRTIYHVAENSKGYLGAESGKVSVIEGLGSLYVPRMEKLKKERKLLLIEGTSDLDLLKIWSATLGQDWPPGLVAWLSTGKASERKTLFEELNKEIGGGLRAISLRDRDNEAQNTTALDLSDKNNPDPAIGQGQAHRMLHRKWRRRQIENYLVLPAAIARASVAKGSGCTEEEVGNFLREEHSVVINNTFTASDCSQPIADLHGKELTYADVNNTESRFGVTRFEVAAAMRPEEICDDVKTLLRQIHELFG